MMETLDIKLLGKDYHVSVQAEERDALLEAARYLEDKLAEIAKKTQAGGEKLAIMTALNIAHEFLHFQHSGGVDLQSMKRRISLINARLDGVLAQQERLF
jgi:cell division protein ZapA